MSQGNETRLKMLEYIKAYTKEHGYAPSMAEIADAMYYSQQTTVYSHIYKMLVTGMLEADYDWRWGRIQSRGYRVGRGYE